MFFLLMLERGEYFHPLFYSRLTICNMSQNYFDFYFIGHMMFLLLELERGVYFHDCFIADKLFVIFSNI